MCWLKGRQGEDIGMRGKKTDNFSQTPRRWRLWFPPCASIITGVGIRRWRIGGEVNIWRNANVASICMSHWPMHRSHFKSTEISEHPTILLLARSITFKGPVCLYMCEYTTITSKSVNKTISVFPLHIWDNLVPFISKFTSVFYFFVSEIERTAQRT